MDAMSVKKIINNYVFIANLAPLLDGPEADALATASRVFAKILDGFGIKPSTDGFEGCEQAQLLIKWCFHGEKADPQLMKKWTAEIVAAISDLADGKTS